MLILRLMAHCNNHCAFCCVRNEMAHAEDIPFETIKTRISQYPPEVSIDFFGGEPTLYPHFIEVLEYARFRGNPCTIATNGRLFSNKQFTKTVASFGIDQIRTSLYGHDSRLHDFHTSSLGSFRQTLKGITNILEEKVELYVNIVITSFNLENLVNMVELLDSAGVTNIKFSSITNTDTCLNFVPDLSRVAPLLQEAILKCKSSDIKFASEKTPLCLLSDEYQSCAYEPDLYVYRKTSKCNNCLASDFCVGIPKEQLIIFGDGFIKPFQEPKYKKEQFEQEFQKPDAMDFVRWTDDLLPALTVLIKACNTCNMNCDYCYASHNFHGKRVVSKDVLHALFNDLSHSHYDRIDFNWHGGEPLIAGEEFLRLAVELQNNSNIKKDRTIVNRIQTNGTLLSDNIAIFLKINSFDTGVSIDGPKSINDFHRKFYNGEGSFDTVMKKLGYLDKYKIPTAILTVVTSESTKRAKELYDFFCEFPLIQSSIDFLPCFDKLPQNSQAVSSTITPEDYAEFMITLFDNWFEDDKVELRISFFENILAVLLGGVADLCYLKRSCNGFITIHPNGDIYPCDRFAGLDAFNLGNILEKNLLDILSSKFYLDMRSEFDSIPVDCWQCEWFRLCHGGCAYEGFAMNGSLNSKSYYCIGLQQIFNHIDHTLSKSIEGYERFSKLIQ